MIELSLSEGEKTTMCKREAEFAFVKKHFTNIAVSLRKFFFNFIFYVLCW